MVGTGPAAETLEVRLWVGSGSAAHLQEKHGHAALPLGAPASSPTDNSRRSGSL